MHQTAAMYGPVMQAYLRKYADSAHSVVEVSNGAIEAYKQGPPCQASPKDHALN